MLKEFVGLIAFSDEKCLHTIERKWPLHERSLAFSVNGALKNVTAKGNVRTVYRALAGHKNRKNFTRKGTLTIKN